jgi:hypothetical protein
MKTASQIAKEIGVTRQWVHRIARELGLKPEKVGDYVHIFNAKQVEQIKSKISKRENK